MLIKEYRISLPMSVEEYRIAQLYMIQRKSREESHGEGSGVEIIENEPYDDGPGGKGQYTYKIYHVAATYQVGFVPFCPSLPCEWRRRLGMPTPTQRLATGAPLWRSFTWR